MDRRSVLKGFVSSAIVGCFMLGTTSCSLFMKPSEVASKKLQDFLNAGYSEKTANNFSFIKDASLTEVLAIFTERFSHLTEFIDIKSTKPEVLVAELKNFTIVRELSAPADIRVEVDAEKVESFSSHINVPEGAIAIYFDDNVNLVSSEPLHIAYTLFTPDDDDWVVSLGITHRLSSFHRSTSLRMGNGLRARDTAMRRASHQHTRRRQSYSR
ncbi:hypothetical protein RCH21_002626 [Arthrobacter sp. PL16]|uniref:hypothetical protein n=1 Tax=Arthrobacter sp. PL16 TaxID=3071720 RepID=UPI002E056EB8|nr:hypothetical protein [Arthrobacter sp. PL16]